MASVTPEIIEDAFGTVIFTVLFQIVDTSNTNILTDAGTLVVDDESGAFVSANKTYAVLIEGTQRQVNEEMASLRYIPSADYTDSVGLRYTQDDDSASPTFNDFMNMSNRSSHEEFEPNVSHQYNEDQDAVWDLGIITDLRPNLPITDTDLSVRYNTELQLSDPLAGTITNSQFSDEGNGLYTYSAVDISSQNTLLSQVEFTPSADYVSAFNIGYKQTVTQSYLISPDPDPAPIVQVDNPTMFSVSANAQHVEFTSSGPLSYNEDTILSFVPGQITDLAEGKTYTVTLTLSDPNAGVLSSTSVTGSKSVVNSLLSSTITFTPSADYTGNFSINYQQQQLTDNIDQGNADFAVSINETHDEFARFISQATYTQESDFASNQWGFGTITDLRPDNIDANIQYTLELTLSNPGAGELLNFTNQGSGVWTFTGTKLSCNSALNPLQFKPSSGFRDNFNIAYNQFQDTDGIGQWGTSLSISREIIAPTVNFFPIVDYDTLEVQLNNISTDDNLATVTWLWDLGDGNTASTENVLHTYAKEDYYLVTLDGTDDDNLSDSAADEFILSRSDNWGSIDDLDISKSESIQESVAVATNGSNTWILVNDSGTNASRSIDNGVTWNGFNLSGFGNGRWASIDANGQTWVAVSGDRFNREQTGLARRSIDDGLSWSSLPDGLSTGNIAANFTVIKGHNGTWIALAKTGWASRSIDDGASWVALPKGLNADVNATFYDLATDENGVWIAVGYVGDLVDFDGYEPSQCARSTDDGLTWSAITLPEGFINAEMGIDTDGQGVWLITCGNGGTFRSTNNGLNWNTTTGFASESPFLCTNRKGTWVAGKSVQGSSTNRILLSFDNGNSYHNSNFGSNFGSSSLIRDMASDRNNVFIGSGYTPDPSFPTRKAFATRSPDATTPYLNDTASQAIVTNISDSGATVNSPTGFAFCTSPGGIEDPEDVSGTKKYRFNCFFENGAGDIDFAWTGTGGFDVTFYNAPIKHAFIEGTREQINNYIGQVGTGSAEVTADTVTNWTMNIRLDDLTLGQDGVYTDNTHSIFISA